MLSSVLVAAGSFPAVSGCLRGDHPARAARVPLAGEGDPTRAHVGATHPLPARTREGGA